jgi:hypothetical protein
VTISAEQARFARQLCEGLPLEIRLQDYRELDERFDAILSVGMFEHVGDKNYRTYFETARRCLAERPVPAAHHRHQRQPPPHRSVDRTLHLPQFDAAFGRTDPHGYQGQFVMEDWHNFGTDYDLTLQAWRANVEAAWDRLDARYDELPADVALSGRVDGHVPHPPRTTVATGAVPAACPAVTSRRGDDRRRMAGPKIAPWRIIDQSVANACRSRAAKTCPHAVPPMVHRRCGKPPNANRPG